MAVTIAPPVPDVQPYTVLRAICVGGARVEPGAAVSLTRQQAQELSAAGKVSEQPLLADTDGEVVVPAPAQKSRPRGPARNTAG